MSYTVLARKYRSRTFDEVVGQAPVATTLVNAIKAGRIHHGYLFTGTRGVGKTSMARILAKALNCLKFEAATATPCCACDSCVAIAEGQDIDVVEIDAASNTGVENIRELRANTAFRPARARFKIYIIDEVHMLSSGAFNALLKTLEEPPGHVKFILATTEIQKVPATIRSRCQCFNFGHIGPDAIADTLARIIAAEGAAAEPDAVRRVARLANGSMRDALSILDQLLSVSPDRLTAAALDELLPPPQNERILSLLQSAAEGDVAAVLARVEETLNQGRGIEVFCNDAIDVLRALLLLRACGADTPIADVPAAARAEYTRLSGQFELSHYVQMIAMLEELKRGGRYSSAGRALLDAVAVRFARMRAWSSIERLLEALPAGDEKKKALGPAAEAGASPPATAPHAEPPAAGQTRSATTGEAAATRGASPPAAGASPGGAPNRASAAVAAAPSTAVTSAARPEPIARPEPAARPGPAARFDPAAPPPPASDAAPHAAAQRAALAAAQRSAAEVAPSGGAPGFALTAEEREAILRDPVVQQVVELFNGVVVNMERTAGDAPPAE